MEKADIAVIGGSGLEELFEKPIQSLMKTPYGTAPSVSIGKSAGKQVAFLLRHVRYVSNMTADMQERLSALELPKVTKQIVPNLQKLLIETIKGLPIVRKKTCPCASALRSARFK